MTAPPNELNFFLRFHFFCFFLVVKTSRVFEISFLNVFFVDKIPSTLTQRSGRKIVDMDSSMYIEGVKLVVGF